MGQEDLPHPAPPGAMLAPIRLGNATASLNLSVSPTRLRRYCCAVRRDARHTVRGQPRRKALRSYPAGQVRRKEKHPLPYVARSPFTSSLPDTFFHEPEASRTARATARVPTAPPF